jgi:hypothetical protein
VLQSGQQHHHKSLKLCYSQHNNTTTNHSLKLCYRSGTAPPKITQTVLQSAQQQHHKSLTQIKLLRNYRTAGINESIAMTCIRATGDTHTVAVTLSLTLASIGTIRLNARNYTFCPHRELTCSVRVSKHTTIISLYNIHHMI